MLNFLSSLVNTLPSTSAHLRDEQLTYLGSKNLASQFAPP